jgi:hypothetical protein
METPFWADKKMKQTNKKVSTPTRREKRKKYSNI